MKHQFVLHQDAEDAWLEVPMELFRLHSERFCIHYGSRMSASSVFLIFKPDAVNFLYLLARDEWMPLPKLGITSVNDFPNVDIHKLPLVRKSNIRDLPPLTQSLVWPLNWVSFDRNYSLYGKMKKVTPSALRKQLELSDKIS